MKAVWTNEVVRDLDRIRQFLNVVNPQAASLAVASLRQAPRRLLEYPRLGLRLEEFEHHEVRRLIVGNYELRYQIIGDVVSILRISHGRENR